MAYDPLSGLKPSGKKPQDTPAPSPSGGGGGPQVHKPGTGGESKARAAAAKAKAAAAKAKKEAEAAKRRADEAARKRQEAIDAQVKHQEAQTKRIADANNKNALADEAAQRAQKKAGESADILAAVAQKKQAEDNQKRRAQLAAKLDQLKGAKAPEDETIEEKQQREDALRAAGLLPQTVATPGAMRGPVKDYPSYSGPVTSGTAQQYSPINLARQGIDWLRNALGPTGEPVTSSMGPEVGLGMPAQFPNVQAAQGQGQLPNMSFGMPPAPAPNVPQGLPWQQSAAPYSSPSIGGPRVELPGVDNTYFNPAPQSMAPVGPPPTGGAYSPTEYPLPEPQSLAPETGLPNLPVFLKTGDNFSGNFPVVDMTAPGQQPMLPLQESMGDPAIHVPWTQLGFGSNAEGVQFFRENADAIMGGPGSFEDNLADAIAGRGAAAPAPSPAPFDPLSGLGRSHSTISKMPMAPTTEAEPYYPPYGYGGFFPFMMFGGGGGGYTPDWTARVNPAYTTWMARGI